MKNQQAEIVERWNRLAGEFEALDSRMRERTRRSSTVDVYLRAFRRGQSSALEMANYVIPAFRGSAEQARREADQRIREFHREVERLRSAIERETPVKRTVQNQMGGSQQSLRLPEAVE